ncbi:hypothetical protein QWT36_23955, partial [Salmonella enterica subsp. enterica serovar Typhi]|nr:hypothetical protein [Salmonella enterica subsp. enterica serovar Typhi]
SETIATVIASNSSRPIFLLIINIILSPELTIHGSSETIATVIASNSSRPIFLLIINIILSPELTIH